MYRELYNARAQPLFCSLNLLFNDDPPCFRCRRGFHKLRPNDGNISTQHFPTLLGQLLRAPAKRSQHLNATGPTDRNIVGRNMLHAFGHPVATCCDMLRVENRTSAHAQAQYCCTNLGSVSRSSPLTGPVKLFCFPFRMGVSKALNITQ